jgi:hypothetical protein
MLEALEALHERGKGIIAMKVLGHGLLEDDTAGAIAFVAGLLQVDTLCLGMRSRQQIWDYAQAIAAAEDGGKSSTGGDER